MVDTKPKKTGKGTGTKLIQKGQRLPGAGRPKLPYVLHEARDKLRVDFETIVIRFTQMPILELHAFLKAKQGTGLEMAVASCLYKAITKGENSNLAFFLNRIVGIPKQQVEISGQINNQVTVTKEQVIRMAHEITAIEKLEDNDDSDCG